MFGKDVDDRNNLMEKRYFLLGEPEGCLEEWLSREFVLAQQLERNQGSHTERILVNSDRMSHSFPEILSLRRRVFATVLCRSISTSLSRGTRRYNADSIISATEFHRVATERLMSFGSIFARVQQAARSSLRRGLWNIRFASLAI
jgi:hypothetical protein